MLWADLDVESDSDLNDVSSGYSWLSVSSTPSIETGFKKQSILRQVQKLMSDGSTNGATSEDDTTDECSCTSSPMRSGTCTPSSTTSSRTSKLHLRNMPLTREHLKRMQRRPEDKDDPSIEDDSSSIVSNKSVSSEDSMNMAQPRQVAWGSTFTQLQLDLSDILDKVHLDISANTPEHTEGGRPGPAVSERSAGSVGHDTGSCKPCMFQFSTAGCFSGPDCQFCHFSHCRAKFPRPSKGKRDRIKKLLSSAADKEGSEDALMRWTMSSTSGTP